MDTAEKLTTIAENEEKVHIAGMVKGEDRMSEALDLLNEYAQTYIDGDETRRAEIEEQIETWDYWEGTQNES